MFGWLRRLFGGEAAISADVEPLSFDYKAKDGTVSRVHLRRWVEDGEYVHGTSLAHDRRLTYRLDRITRFHDLSYRQLRNYRPPSGSPLNPGRLP